MPCSVEKLSKKNSQSWSQVGKAQDGVSLPKLKPEEQSWKENVKDNKDWLRSPHGHLKEFAGENGDKGGEKIKR